MFATSVLFSMTHLLLFIFLLAPPVLSTVRLPQWFSDNMVLQTSEENGPTAFLAGMTDPVGEHVRIYGDAGEYSINSDPISGHWKVELVASTFWNNTDNMTISIAGATGAPVTVTGVKAGDVFFCAGQSNMLFSLHQALNYSAEATTLSNFPNFRFFMTNRALNASPQFNLTDDNSNCDAAAPPNPPHPPLPGTCSAGKFLNNTAFGHGHGPSIGHTSAKDATDCCSLCFSPEWASRGCSFFTFEPPIDTATTNGTCWLKSNDHGPALTRPGYVSGGHVAPEQPKPCNKWITSHEAMANNAAFLLSFSAVCYMTVRDIARYHTGQRPMGLIQSAWGGSRLEAWMSAEALATVGPPVSGNVPTNNHQSPKDAANDKSYLYNGMVSPWTNFSVRCVCWYQGEENADQSCQANSTMWPSPPAAHTQPLRYYAVSYAAMIRDWRHKKGVDFTLGTMQLPPSVKTGDDPSVTNPMWAGRPDIRGAQAVSQAHPDSNTTDGSGVAVTIDLGGASNWGYDHPPNKNEMSRRLALQLLHTAYALTQDDIPLWTGPVLQGINKQSTAITLTFTAMSSAGGLTLRDVKAPFSVNDGPGGAATPSNNCTKCCNDGGAPFEITTDPEPATARRNGRNITWIRLPRSNISITSGNTVVLTTGDTGVTGLRYAWTDFVDCVLDNGNSSHIPAAPFRHWF